MRPCVETSLALALIPVFGLVLLSDNLIGIAFRAMIQMGFEAFIR